MVSPRTASAAECTAAEAEHDEQQWAAAAASSACAPYARGNTYFSGPCDATDCLAVLTEMLASLSDCTYSGVSNKIEVQNGLAACTGDDIKNPGSPTTDAPSTTSPPSTTKPPTTTAPSPAATASNTDCVANEIASIKDLFTAAATSDECAADSSVSATAIVISTLCGSSCASKLEELANSLPNCYYGYQSENIKSDLLTQLDGCVGADDSYSISVSVSPEETTDVPPTTATPPATTTPSPDTNATSEPTPAPTKDASATPAPTKEDSGTYC
ncbi:hypothetical protein PHYBOEH_009805 [Phytophthora boehmeriae]|uniref:Elicitin n=1 Tax=Phytophthora boehmeriae TaxID=109152 RepID=A0A8T1VUQ9_9STRA|nr:hypothetical protein PHYBOEH_009805 [Phytophthora boehmeriae]